MGILSDFAQAFSSLAQVWMVMVLRRMAVDERLVLLIQHMCDGNTTREVVGSPVSAISIQRGAKHSRLAALFFLWLWMCWPVG